MRVHHAVAVSYLATSRAPEYNSLLADRPDPVVAPDGMNDTMEWNPTPNEQTWPAAQICRLSENSPLWRDDPAGFSLPGRRHGRYTISNVDRSGATR